MIRLEEKTVVLHLSDEGRRILKQVGVEVPGTSALFDIEATRDEGIWVRFEYDDGPHLVLIRWEYVLAMDVPLGATVTEGLVN